MFAEIALTATTSGATVASFYAHRLHRRLHTDPLTGLANRAALYRAFDRARHRNRDGVVGLLLGDIDRFKLINDTHGHSTGDAVLTALGDTLVRVCRRGEVPVRLHGDEFAILLTRLSRAAEANHRAAELRAQLAITHHINATPLTVSVSLGAASGPAREVTLPRLLTDADTGMYQDKTAHSVTTLPTSPVARRPRDFRRGAA